MKTLDKPRRIAGITLGNALMNGAYLYSKSLGDVEKLAGSQAGAIVVGSISVKPRKPNASKGYWQHKEKFYALNSFGMPNGGLPYFNKHLLRMVQIAHDAGKPLIANVVGFSNQEFVQLIVFAQSCNVDMVELNFGCPNAWDGTKQKRILSYHPAAVKDTLDEISKQKFTVPLSIKISPLPPDLLEEVGRIIATSGVIQTVVATNSYPNASITTGTRRSMAGDDTLAGLAGRALKPISIGVVSQLRTLLPKEISIIGCGGVSSANDVDDYLAAGASGVQMASSLMDEGLSVFDKILYQSMTNS